MAGTMCSCSCHKTPACEKFFNPTTHWRFQAQQQWATVIYFLRDWITQSVAVMDKKKSLLRIWGSDELYIQHKNLVGSVGGYFLWALYVAMHHSISANMRFVWQTPPLQLAIRKTLGRRWRQMRGPPFIGAPCMLPIFLTGHLCKL